MIGSLVFLTFSTLVCSAHGTFEVDTKIVGGENTTINKYPYQISLQISSQHVCGGSLIRPNVVLTAAHCMIFPAFLYKVRAGTAVKMQGGTVIKVEEYWNHPNYTPEFDYDVSVLKLKKAFPIDKSIQLIDLQPAGEEIPEGTIGIVTGWGDTATGGPDSSVLQEVGVPKASKPLCKMNELQHNITDRMVCYGFFFGGKDACQMDSGGPLVVEGKQVGIVSWGTGCAVPLYPGVYTRISNKAITEHIQNAIMKYTQ